MTSLVVVFLTLAAFVVPVFVETKVFTPSGDGRDHIWNILKRVLATVGLLWFAGYLAGAVTLSLAQNPLGFPLQFAILASLIAIPVSLVGYVLGRRSQQKE